MAKRLTANTVAEEPLLGRLEGRSDGAASALPYLTVTLVSFSSEFRVIMVL